MATVLEIIKKTTDFFAGKEVESPRLNSELIVGHALGLKRMALYLQFERVLTDAELDGIRPLVRRRGQREPIQYVLGETDFCGLRIRTDRRALIPRPETELLVSRILERFAEPPPRVLDLGTGTGAIALALAAGFPGAQFVAVDVSEEALALAAENVTALGFSSRISLVKSNWFDALPPDAQFELIVANPPYLTEAELAAAVPEVRSFEPRAALTSAGPEGNADLLKLLDEALGHLVPGGMLALETGIAQHEALAERARARGFLQIESSKDLTGRDRFILARR